MLYICFNVFEECELLEEHILAAKKAAPSSQIVVVDGAYQQFKHEHPDSRDGTIEIARRLADCLIECDKPWKNEPEKRSQYFVGKDGDEYLVVDGDEELVGTFPVNIPDRDGRCKFKEGMKHRSVFRYHKHSDGMRYFGHHNALWRGNEFVDPQVPLISQELVLIHKVSRHVSSPASKYEYYHWLKQTEIDFRVHEKKMRGKTFTDSEIRSIRDGDYGRIIK